MSYRTAAKLLGQLLVFLGAAEVAPALIGLAYGEDASVLAYLIGGAITAVVGFVLMRAGRGSDQTIHRRDALLVVAGGWVAAGLSGAICFYLDTATAAASRHAPPHSAEAAGQAELAASAPCPPGVADRSPVPGGIPSRRADSAGPTSPTNSTVAFISSVVYLRDF